MRSRGFYGHSGPNRQGPSSCVTREKFWLVFRETYPQIALTVVVLDKISAIPTEAWQRPWRGSGPAC
jgi:hypothetical protein